MSESVHRMCVAGLVGRIHTLCRLLIYRQEQCRARKLNAAPVNQDRSLMHWETEDAAARTCRRTT